MIFDITHCHSFPHPETYHSHELIYYFWYHPRNIFLMVYIKHTHTDVYYKYINDSNIEGAWTV